MNTNSARIRIY